MISRLQAGLLTGSLYVLLSGLTGCSGSRPELKESKEQPPAALKLVWSDEFNYTGLPDSTKWNYDIGGDGWGNNELQFYTILQK